MYLLRIYGEVLFTNLMLSSYYNFCLLYTSDAADE